MLHTYLLMYSKIISCLSTKRCQIYHPHTTHLHSLEPTSSIFIVHFLRCKPWILDTVTKDLSNILQSDNGCKYTETNDSAIKKIPLSCESGFAIFNVLHLNIRSLNWNKDNLVQLLSDLEERGVIIHVIGLCQTFLTPASKGLADIENYSAIHKTRVGKMGTGTTLLIHDLVKLVRVLDTPFGECLESTTVEVTFKKKTTLVSEFYRPPNSDSKHINEMLQQYLTIIKGYDLCFLCSDHNYNFLNSGAHTEQ